MAIVVHTYITIYSQNTKVMWNCINRNKLFSIIAIVYIVNIFTYALIYETHASMNYLFSLNWPLILYIWTTIISFFNKWKFVASKTQVRLSWYYTPQIYRITMHGIATEAINLRTVTCQNNVLFGMHICRNLVCSKIKM